MAKIDALWSISHLLGALRIQHLSDHKVLYNWNFPLDWYSILRFYILHSGSPMVNTSPSNARGMDSVLGQGNKITHASWPKRQNIKSNRNNIAINSII